MRDFNYYAPTEIIFGCGRTEEVGKITKEHGDKVLLVTESLDSPVSPVFERVKNILIKEGLQVKHFDGVVPNPTTDLVTEGAKLAREFGANVVLGVGGGSSMDVAKAIAVEATHPGTAWDYNCHTDGPTDATLPIITISTTAGTGSQLTQCAVITKTSDQDKSAIWHNNIFPKVAIVDPEVTATMPKSVTSQTGFDAFCHNFEAYLSKNTSPIVEALALEAIKTVVEFLPKALEDGKDMEARSKMAYADSLGGYTNSNAGVTLPHGLGMQIGGLCPHVTHGQALAIIYPEFTRFTWKSAVEKFATVGRIINPELINESDEVAAEKSCEAIDGFLKEINLWIGFKDLNVTMEEIREISNRGQVLGDYLNNPKVATIDEMYELLTKCYERS
ncbi:MAG TPA: iron-containing alcohol dehydrogenase [Clostridiales bacterium]|nr:iron-containing alcohol dehydrogenase [Clostridiales bacterium]